MWEFSIEMDSEKASFAKKLFVELQAKIKEISGIITSFEQNGKISIVVGCEEFEKSRLKYQICDSISKGICTYFKEDFLEKKLKSPVKDKLEAHAFKKALVCFDRETDRFLINKALSLEKSIVLEGFFHFKLRALKEKWEELVKIANDNSTYLLSDDSFIELLKFLIDNIEVATDEVIVELGENSANILNQNNEIIEKEINDLDLVTKLLELSPRKIYWQSEKQHTFLEKIFEKRIAYPDKNFIKSLQN